MPMELFGRQKDSVGQGERTVLVNVELTSIASNPMESMSSSNLLCHLGSTLFKPSKLKETLPKLNSSLAKERLRS